MSEIVVRKAERKDCAAMFELVKELAAYERAPEQVTLTLAEFEASGFGERPVYWAFVAEHHGRVVGFALYYIRYSTWKGERMYLEDLLVTESYRRQKIGFMLFEALIAEARTKGFRGISWQVLDWNEPAKEFYRRYDPVFDNEWVNCMIEEPFDRR